MNDLERSHRAEPTPEIPRTLIEELFANAKAKFGGLYNQSYMDYTEGYQNEGRTIVAPTFAPLLLGKDPKNFHLVYYMDTEDPYFKPDNRSREVGIANRESMKSSNDRLIELQYQKRAGKYYLTLSENINHASFLSESFNESDSEENPYGTYSAKYEILPNGERVPHSLNATRLDEVMTEVGNQVVPSRWLRTLDMQLAKPAIKYTDLFMLDRKKQSWDRDEATVAYNLTGTLEDPQQLTITLGDGGYNKTPLFTNEQGDLEVVLNARNQTTLDLLQNDPEFSFLRTHSLTKSEAVRLLAKKVQELKDHWDQPTSVFNQGIESAQPKIISE